MRYDRRGIGIGMGRTGWNERLMGGAFVGGVFLGGGWTGSFTWLLGLGLGFFFASKKPD